MADAHGSQCGFCTPGFVMSMYALLRSTKAPLSAADIEEALAGNLCRCTGYRPIWDALATFIGDGGDRKDGKAAPNGCSEGATVFDCNASNGVHASDRTAICPSTGLPCNCKAAPNGEKTNEGKKDTERAEPIDGELAAANGKPGANGCVAEPIFPPELARAKHNSFDMAGVLDALFMCRLSRAPLLVQLDVSIPSRRRMTTFQPRWVH
jgi:xanthine dehydrogenase/oxidase